MAKGRIVLPPRKNIGKTIKNIVKQGPKTQPAKTVAKGKGKSHVEKVAKSKIPNPSQNQRGRIMSKDDRDLTR